MVRQILEMLVAGEGSKEVREMGASTVLQIFERNAESRRALSAAIKVALTDKDLRGRESLLAVWEKWQ